jgi:hypothetical protein
MNIIEVELLLFCFLVLGVGAYFKGKKQDSKILISFGKRSFIVIIVLMVVTFLIR